MGNKYCGNGSKNCVAFRKVMRNGIAIGNPSFYQLSLKIYIYLTTAFIYIGIKNSIKIVTTNISHDIPS